MKIARIILCTVFLFSCSQVQSKSKKCDINDYNYVGKNSLIILMSPDGDDNNCGFTLTTPVLTLNRVQEIIVSTVSEQGKDIEVRIAPGIYKNQTVDWTFSMPNNTITFMPLFDDNNRPIFDGEGTKETWFGFKQDKGEKTNLIFNHIRVENYATAISLNGNRNDHDGFNSSNRIVGNYFYNIGEDSTAVVRLVNSKNNEISNNHFIEIHRDDSCQLLHAIYIAHMSSGNNIVRNRFKDICGDPIKIRDFSNNNVIKENKFIRVGVKAAYTDWYCDHDIRDDCTKPSPECPSWDNQVRDNIYNLDHKGQQLKLFEYFQDDEATGCSPPSKKSRRLRTSNNDRE